MSRTIISVLIFTAAIQCLFSQPDTTSGIIKLRQRLVHIHHDEGKEVVDSFRILHIMIAGNVYQTEKHLNYAYDEKAKKYDFRNEFKYIQPILNLGDISIVNLKTSFANNVKNMFSSPDEFALALKYAGINAIMHANIHTANISKPMLKRTRDLLNVYDMYHTGAFTDNAQRNGNNPLIINKKGFRIAILNYTRVTNRPAISRDFVINEIDKSTIERDMRMATIQKPDFIIAYFDWGANNQDVPNYMQMDIVQYAFQLGANLVVGTNPNAPMRIDYVNYNRNGEMKQGIVAYSLGNLIASNDEVRNRRGYVIDLELKKNNFTSETDVNDWGAIPVYTYYDTTSTRGTTKVFSVPCANVESGDIFPKIPYIEKRRAVNSAYEVRKLLGATADEIQYNLTELAVNNVQETIDLTSASLNNKFSQKRASEIEPANAPVLPLATLGSNNPPSLAVLYEEPKKTIPPNDIPISKTAKIGQEIVANMAVQKTESIYQSSAPNLYPQSTDSISGKTNTSSADKAAMADKNIISKDGSVISSSQEKQRSAAAKNYPKAKATSVQSNTATTDSSYVAKNDSTSESRNSNDIKNKTGGSVALSDDETAKETGSISSKKSGTKNQAANTNYHTTGKNYELAVANNSSSKKKKEKPETKEREKETGIEIDSKTNNGIAATSKSEIKSDIQPVTGPSTKVLFDTTYRIQFYALKKFIPLDTNYYTHLKGYEVVEEEGLFKYLLGKFKTSKECEDYWKAQIQPRYKQSFIIKYTGNKRISQ